MVADRVKNEPDASQSQPTFPRVLRVRDEVLVDLDELLTAWEINTRRVYQAVEDGRGTLNGKPLRRVRRGSSQAYYVYSDLVAAFGEPRTPGPLNSAVKGP